MVKKWKMLGVSPSVLYAYQFKVLPNCLDYLYQPAHSVILQLVGASLVTLLGSSHKYVVTNIY